MDTANDFRIKLTEVAGWRFRVWIDT